MKNLIKKKLNLKASQYIDFGSHNHQEKIKPLMLIKTFLFFLSKNKNCQSGFSLLELLLGASLMLLVLSMSGFALVYTSSLDQKASAKGQIQYNSNRAVEFIKEEIKSANKIESDAISALAEAPDFSLPEQGKPVLVLQVPDIPQRIIYYTQPSKNIWIKPNMILRWGPSLNEEGQYEKDEIDNPKSWQSDVLIDQIDNSALISNCLKNWQLSNVNAVQGFHACVDPSEKLVEFHLATTASNPTWNQDITYQLKTAAFAKSNIVQGFTENKLAFNIIDNQLILDSPAKVRFEVLGGQITCGRRGKNIPVKTNIYANETQKIWDSDSPSDIPVQPAGTTFDIESIAGDGSICNGFNMNVSTQDSSTSQVKVLVNGDPVPDILPFANQNQIESFAQKYIENGKIKIRDNEAIYLFELGSENKNSSAFDLQDNVVLATVEKP
ncbi:MAG: hypothetical protein QNJ33_10840 [Crocosphaera sp.]|nr:hypothetical protein [Crocosphaera sp.]